MQGLHQRIAGMAHDAAVRVSGKTYCTAKQENKNGQKADERLLVFHKTSKTLFESTTSQQAVKV